MTVHHFYFFYIQLRYTVKLLSYSTVLTSTIHHAILSVPQDESGLKLHKFLSSVSNYFHSFSSVLFLKKNYINEAWFILLK